MISGFNRVLFLSCSLAYQRLPIYILNELLHKNIIIIFLLVWLVKLVITIKEIILLINKTSNYFDTEKAAPKKKKKLLKSQSVIESKFYFKKAEKPIL